MMKNTLEHAQIGDRMIQKPGFLAFIRDIRRLVSFAIEVWAFDKRLG
jgi:hypothetical protein